MTGLKTNERPGYAGGAPALPRVRLQGPRGPRPHPRAGLPAGDGDPRILRPRRGRRHRQAAQLGGGQRPSQRRSRPRGDVRLGLLRRRGHDAQALAPACARPCDPDPQAHLPHHGDPLQAARRPAGPPPVPRGRRAAERRARRVAGGLRRNRVAAGTEAAAGKEGTEPEATSEAMAALEEARAIETTSHRHELEAEAESALDYEDHDHDHDRRRR